MRKFLLGILVGLVLTVLGSVVFLFVLMRLASRPPDIPDNAVLVMGIEGDVPEAPRTEIPIPVIGRRAPPTVRDYWELMRKAAVDKRIHAVVIAPANVSAGWAKLDELKSGIEVVKRSGKPVYAWLRAPRAREYYLALAADRIYMPPEDALDLKGLRFELMYLKGSLNKLGVEFEMAHAGKYKDAPETFTRTGPSPESREVMTSLLDALYSQLVNAIAAGRKKSTEEVRALLDDGPFLASRARAAGLVDELKYQDEVFAELEARMKVKDIHRFAHTDYMDVPSRDAGLKADERIAFVAAEGMIVRRPGDDLIGDEGTISSQGMRELLRRAGDDRSIKGVILRIDSPGGDSFASDEIWREVNLLSKKKPVVISMSDAAASGGYYIAMSGDPVVAYPGTFTGSIGVYYGKVNLHGLYDKLGITKEIMSRGRFAEIDSDYAPLSAAARAKLENIVQQTYETFLSRVAQGRKRDVAEIRAIAEGRVWLGSQAAQNRLIDEIGGLDKAIELVKKKAGIGKDKTVALVSYPARRSIFDRMMSRPDPLSVLPPPLRAVSTLSWARGGVFYLMPFVIQVN